MSIHPSLRISDKDKKTRSVLKRTERLHHMLEKEQWKEGNACFGLPKIKTIRIKIKKEKAEKAETGAVTAEGTPSAAAPTPGAKETAAKAPASKGK